MLEPYEINIVENLQVLAMMSPLFILSVVGPFKPWCRVATYIMFIISGVSSLTLYPEALRRGDWDVFAYHSIWVVLGIAAAHLIAREWPKARDHGKSKEELGIVEDPIEGSAEEHSEPVYNITTLK